MQVISWPQVVRRSVWPGLEVTVRLQSPARIRSFEIDLIGDGVPGAWLDFGVNTDGRNVGRVAFMPERTGRFELVMRTTDERGCTAQTGVLRMVNVVQ